VNGAGEEVSYVSSVDGLRVRWSGFSEPCSGVRQYTITLRAARSEEGEPLWESHANSTQSSVSLSVSMNVSLVHGDSYTLMVTATSRAGFSTITAQPARFVADLTPPVVTSLLDGAETRVDLTCAPAEAPPGCTWSGVADAESGIVKLEWALGNHTLGSNLKGFEVPPSETSAAGTATMAATITMAGSVPPQLPNGTAHVYCTLRVTNGAGAVRLFSSDGARVYANECGSLPTTCAVPVGTMAS
jgi:hypothetical protein